MLPCSNDGNGGAQARLSRRESLTSLTSDTAVEAEDFMGM